MKNVYKRERKRIWNAKTNSDVKKRQETGEKSTKRQATERKGGK